MRNKFLLLFMAIMAVSCGSSNEEKKDYVTETSVETSNKLEPVLQNYLRLKDALVNSDSLSAAKTAQQLEESMRKARLNSGVVNAAALIASEGLEKQRESFKQITDTLIHHLISDDIPNSLFIQHCPMAFDNTGASWISDSEEIYNPYFGDRMLHCGRVESKL